MLHSKVVSRLVLIAVIALSCDFIFRMFGMFVSHKKHGQQNIEEYIMQNPQVIMQSLEQFHRQQMEAKRVHAMRMLAANKEKLIQDSDAKVGSNNPKITIVEFLDFSCGYSRKFLPIKQRILKEHPEVQFVVKELPMFGDRSMMASRASKIAYALAPEKYWAYHQELLMLKEGASQESSYLQLANKVGMNIQAFQKELLEIKKYDDSIANNVKMAMEIGIEGTPAFIIGEELIPGFLDYDGFKTKINAFENAQKH
jgi:protein-disulfide isomerase